MGSLAQHKGIEIRIGNVSLTAKLDAIGAALAAVREAHRDEMSPKAWAALHRAQEAVAEAMLHAPRFPCLLGGGSHAPDHKAGYLTTTTPAEAQPTVSAGTGGESA